MRSYIFTSLEKRVLMGWLNNKVPSGDIRVRKILSRMKLFRDLSEDVNLYIRVREAVAAAST